MCISFSYHLIYLDIRLVAHTLRKVPRTNTESEYLRINWFQRKSLGLNISTSYFWLRYFFSKLRKLWINWEIMIILVFQVFCLFLCDKTILYKIWGQISSKCLKFVLIDFSLRVPCRLWMKFWKVWKKLFFLSFFHCLKVYRKN